MSDVDNAADIAVPDANPVEDVVETTEAEAKPSESSPETPDPGEVQNAAQKKINKLTWQRREAERERDLYRQRVEAFERQQKATEPPAVSEKPKTLADFEFDEGRYQQHLFTEAEKRAVRAAEDRLKQEQERTTKERTQSAFRQREEAFSESVEDYLEVTRSANLPINPHMAEVLAESEEGPALAYHLGKNLELADQIAQLSPLAAARELGRLEAKLIAEREKAKERTVSKAPPPTPKIDAADSPSRVSTTDPSGDKLSDDEWFAAERKREARKRAGK